MHGLCPEMYLVNQLIRIGTSGEICIGQEVVIKVNLVDVFCSAGILLGQQQSAGGFF